MTKIIGWSRSLKTKRAKKRTQLLLLKFFKSLSKGYNYIPQMERNQCVCGFTNENKHFYIKVPLIC